VNNDRKRLIDLYKLEKEAHYRRCEKSLASFTKAAWNILEPSNPLQWNWHHDLICEHLEAAYNGDIKRLIVNMPPRNMKSILVSIAFPAWCWVKNPSMRFLCGSYSQSLSSKHSIDTRTLIESEWFQERWGSKIVLSSDQNLKTEFTNTSRGHRIATSILGTATGKGGDCLPGDVLITTDQGQIRIDELVNLKNKPNVLSYNHELNRLEWRKIEATKVTNAEEFIEIKSKSGNTIRTTPEHRIYCVQQGYRQAESLRELQTVYSIKEKQSLFSLQKSQNREWSYLHSVLQKVNNLINRAGLRTMRGPIHEAQIRYKQNEKKRTLNSILQQDLLPKAPFIQKQETVHEVQSSGSVKKDKKILRFLQGITNKNSDTEKEKILQDLQIGIHTKNKICSTLLEAMQSVFSFKKNEWSWEFKLQKWEKLPKTFRRDWEKSYFSERWKNLQGLFKQKREKIDCASHRSEQKEQQPIESSHSMLVMPCDAPQLQNDAVAMVRRIRTKSQPVYDLQIEENRNFFANKILIHNCVIADDPHDTTGASSEVERLKTVETFRQKFMTRLDNKNQGRVIVVMQRLHEDDLSGNLLKDGGWEHLSIPAIETKNRVLIFPVSKKSIERKVDDILHPEREGPKVLSDLKTALGSRGFAGQYQQSPAAQEGNIIKRQWIKFYDHLPPMHMFDEIIQSWDMTFTGKAKSDFVVGQVWARLGADKYLIDEMRGRFGMDETLKAFSSLTAKWPVAQLKLIENKANGPAVEDMLKKKISGIVLQEPKGDKVSRLNAVAPQFEAGNIYLPSTQICTWINEWIEELVSFPNATNDDRCDAASQALIRFADSGTVGGLRIITR